MGELCVSCAPPHTYSTVAGGGWRQVVEAAVDAGDTRYAPADFFQLFPGQARDGGGAGIGALDTAHDDDPAELALVVADAGVCQNAGKKKMILSAQPQSYNDRYYLNIARNE